MIAPVRCQSRPGAVRSPRRSLVDLLASTSSSALVEAFFFDRLVSRPSDPRREHPRRRVLGAAVRPSSSLRRLLRRSRPRRGLPRRSHRSPRMPRASSPRWPSHFLPRPGFIPAGSRTIPDWVDQIARRHRALGRRRRDRSARSAIRFGSPTSWTGRDSLPGGALAIAAGCLAMEAGWSSRWPRAEAAASSR